MTFFKNLIRDEQGATAIEYGLIAALIAIAAMAAMGTVGNSVNTTFTKVGNKLSEGNNKVT